MENNNITMTAKTLFNELQEKVNTLNTVFNSGVNYDDAYTAANKAKQELNKELKKVRAAELDSILQAEGAETFWNDYINATTATAWSLLQEKDGGAFYLESTTQRVPYSYVCHASKKVIPTNAGFTRYIQILSHNISRWQLTNDGTNEGASNGTTETLPLSLLEVVKKSEKYWNKYNKDSITRQYNDVVAMMYPDGMTPNYKMLSSDVKNLLTATNNYKKSKKAGNQTFSTNTMQFIEDYIIDTIGSKINGIGVHIRNKTLERMNEKESAAPKSENKPAPVKTVNEGKPAQGKTKTKAAPKKDVPAAAENTAA